MRPTHVAALAGLALLLPALVPGVRAGPRRRGRRPAVHAPRHVRPGFGRAPRIHRGRGYGRPRVHYRRRVRRGRGYDAARAAAAFWAVSSLGRALRPAPAVRYTLPAAQAYYPTAYTYPVTYQGYATPSYAVPAATCVPGGYVEEVVYVQPGYGY